MLRKYRTKQSPIERLPHAVHYNSTVSVERVVAEDMKPFFYPPPSPVHFNSYDLECVECRTMIHLMTVLTDCRPCVHLTRILLVFFLPLPCSSRCLTHVALVTFSTYSTWSSSTHSRGGNEDWSEGAVLEIPDSWRCGEPSEVGQSGYHGPRRGDLQAEVWRM